MVPYHVGGCYFDISDKTPLSLVIDSCFHSGLVTKTISSCFFLRLHYINIITLDYEVNTNEIDTLVLDLTSIL